MKTTSMKLVRHIFLIAISIYLPVQTFAWGAAGHKLVAGIAATQLPQSVKDSVAFYLGTMTMAEASNWMDEIKSDPTNDSLRAYHYINIDKGQEYNPDSTHNIIGELHTVITELKNRGNYSKERINFDLKVLIHLVGDLHQPMHIGYAADRGGNSVKVFFSASSSNLHRVWDSDIIEGYILPEPYDWLNTANYSKEDLAGLKSKDVVHWMMESRKSLDSAYDFKGDNIDRKYIKRNIPVIEKQLFFGGLHLANLLKEIFHS